MPDFGPQDQFDERSRERRVLVQELVREAGLEIARVRASKVSLEALDTNEWQRTQRSAHNIAARAQTLNLGVLANCARELERFAAVVIAGDSQHQTAALQHAAIAIETIDLELSALSKN